MKKVGSIAKKRKQQIDKVLALNKSTESLNKVSLSHTLNLKLLALRQELKSLLLHTYEKIQLRLKAIS